MMDTPYDKAKPKLRPMPMGVNEIGIEASSHLFQTHAAHVACNRFEMFKQIFEYTFITVPLHDLTEKLLCQNSQKCSICLQICAFNFAVLICHIPENSVMIGGW